MQNFIKLLASVPNLFLNLKEINEFYVCIGTVRVKADADLKYRIDAE